MNYTSEKLIVISIVNKNIKKVNFNIGVKSFIPPSSQYLTKIEEKAINLINKIGINYEFYYFDKFTTISEPKYGVDDPYTLIIKAKDTGKILYDGEHDTYM